jgi:rhodanese-related sulfurtransferase
VTQLLGGLGTYPSYFSELREVNRQGPDVYGTFPALERLDVTDVRRLVDRGAALVDVRPIEHFAAGHVPGSLSIQLRPQFSSWLGWLLERTRTLVFVLDADTDRGELVRQCLTIGYERLAGELAEGVRGWIDHGLPLRSISLVGPHELDATRVLDVRQATDFATGHVPGALHIELGSLARDLATLPDGPVTVMCGHGEKAMTGASILTSAGRSQVAVLRGGPGDWAEARRALHA